MKRLGRIGKHPGLCSLVWLVFNNRVLGTCPSNEHQGTRPLFWKSSDLNLPSAKSRAASSFEGGTNHEGGNMDEYLQQEDLDRDFEQQGYRGLAGISLPGFLDQGITEATSSSPLALLIDNKEHGMPTGNDRPYLRHRHEVSQSHPETNKKEAASYPAARGLVEKSPGIKERTTTKISANHCLRGRNDFYGSQDGNQTNFYFFYQIESARLTSETQINGILLDDIESALLDLMIPIFFSECAATSGAIRAGTGRYVGMGSKPADFVLRGFDCSVKAREPCFVVSGSMTAFVTGVDPSTVKAQMREAVYHSMQSGSIEAIISRINSVALLDETLHLATLPSTSAPKPQGTSTQTPTGRPTTKTPTATPTAVLSSVPSSGPTFFLSSPPSFELMSLSPTPKGTDTPTSKPSEVAGPAIPELSSTSPPGTYFPTSEQQLEAFSSRPPAMNLVNTLSPSTASASPTLGASPSATSFATLAPSASGETVVAVEVEAKSAIEQIPIWAWVIIAMSICVCCSYAGPDDNDEDDEGVQQTLREQERHSLATNDEHDRERDSLHDSEVFKSVEYVRRLYRQ